MSPPGWIALALVCLGCLSRDPIQHPRCGPSRVALHDEPVKGQLGTRRDMAVRDTMGWGSAL
jgi:hypothetical protein